MCRIAVEARRRAAILPRTKGRGLPRIFIKRSAFLARPGAHYGFPCGDFQGVPAVDDEDYRRLIAQRLPLYSSNKEDSRMTRSLELCTPVSHLARSISCGSLDLPAPLTHEVNS
jgi:hypothetical protein